MTGPRTNRFGVLDVRLIVPLVVAGLGACWVFGGWKGAAGFGIGAAATAFNNWALWMSIKLLGKAAEVQVKEGIGASITVVFLFLKLPIFVVAAIAAHRLGEAALPCFLVGLAMVYSLTLGWAMARR